MCFNVYFYRMDLISKNIILVSYSHIQKWEIIAGVTLISTLAITSIYYLHPLNNNWYDNENFSFANLLKFIFIDQFLIELNTIFILTHILGFYAKQLRIKEMALNLKGVVSYFVKFIPFYLLAYFITIPITVSIRYLYHYFITQQGKTDYWNSYFFLNKELYFSYLTPLSIVITLLIIIAVLRSKNAYETRNNISLTNNLKVVSLPVKTEIGEKIISSDMVFCIYKEGRKYFVCTKDSKTYQINKNLVLLREELGINFVEINRSTLINLDYFEDYSFWENEKYIVRMKDGKEFYSTRNRIKLLKSKIAEYSKL